MEVGQLRSCGLAKESVLGTFVSPTRFLRFRPPDSFFPKAGPLLSKAVGSVPDVNIKQTPGPASLDGMKVPLELEPENCGEILQALFGLDTVAEVAVFVINSANHSIDFKEDGGAQLNATIASSTYAMGTSSTQAGTLCAAVKTALEAAAGAGGTYTVTYSDTTKKMTIAVGGAKTNVQILWLTGTNQATGAYATLGFSHADTANAASVTSDSTTATPVFTHTMVRQAVSQLPTLSFWFDKKPLYPQFAGCMVNKVDIEVKAKEHALLTPDVSGIVYDATGTAKSPTYSSARPFAFNMATITIDGGGVLNVDNLKLSFDNMVQADHVVGNTRYPTKIYSKGFAVELSAEVFFEDATQYNKFLSGDTATFSLTLTSVDDVAGAPAGTKYSIAFTIPNMVYKTANLPIPSGVLKIPFVATVMLDPTAAYSVQAVLKNSVAAAY